MTNIDFLPEIYRHQAKQRKHSAARGLVAALFAAIVASTAVYQQALKRGAQAEYEQWQAPYDVAAAQNTRLASIQSRLRVERAKAELQTFMRHPWPRSQILAAIAAPLPESITLGELRIEREASTAVALPPPKSDKPEETATKAIKEEKDLQKLRAELDRARVLVTLHGETSNTAELNLYLAKLAVSHLFVKAQLLSIEGARDEQGATRFAAQLVVRPAYGLPGAAKPPSSPTDTAGR